jgi:hypothetical protein
MNRLPQKPQRAVHMTYVPSVQHAFAHGVCIFGAAPDEVFLT